MGSIRRGDNTVINLKRFLMISVSSIKRIIQKIQILKMFFNVLYVLLGAFKNKKMCECECIK